MAFPNDLTVFEFIDDCPAGRDLENELDNHEARIIYLEENSGVAGSSRTKTNVFI